MRTIYHYLYNSLLTVDQTSEGMIETLLILLDFLFVFLHLKYVSLIIILFFISPHNRPDMTTKKRRGGKRMRLLKEKFTESEMMKQANRRGFAVDTGEYGDDAMGMTLGMLEKSKDSSGNIRHMAGSVANKRKMRQANTKASRKRAQQMQAGQTNGLASSIVFTPVQGMELVNPDAMKDRVKEANKKWFSDSSGFQSALTKKK